MSLKYTKLFERIELIARVENILAEYINEAISYANSDPQSALTKSRIVLEKILNRIYFHEIGKKPKNSMIGNILSDKEVIPKIPTRILVRMNFIREMTNIGTHGGDVTSDDAERVLHDIISIVEWYTSNYSYKPSSYFEKSQSAEILPQLKERFPHYLRSDIMSVKLGQTKDRCYLEIISLTIRGNLPEEKIQRTDLGFIINGDDRLFLNPKDILAENISRFLNDFDEIGIINCTDLFTHDIAIMLQDYWNEHGKCPDPSNPHEASCNARESLDDR